MLGITVRRIGQAQVLDGLPVRALAGVEGRCVVTQRWQPDQLPPGDYVLDAELRASDGTWLDSMKGYVRLGVEDARTLGLAATESRTRSGSGVALDLKIANTGSEPIAGTAVVQVIDEQGTTVADLRHESRMLEPDQATTLRLRWDTTDVAPGTYSAIGHLRFCGRATDPVVTSITLRR